MRSTRTRQTLLCTRSSSAKASRLKPNRLLRFSMEAFSCWSARRNVTVVRSERHSLLKWRRLSIGHACLFNIHVMHPSAVSHTMLSVRAAIADQIFTFLAPFSAYLWICIICSALAVFVVWIIIGKLSPLGTYTVRRMRRIDSPDEEVKEFAIESGKQECSLVMLSHSVASRASLPCVRHSLSSIL